MNAGDVNEHMVNCYYCCQVRSWFLHFPIYFGQSIMLKCWRCQYTHLSYDEGALRHRAWLYYPCGWWEEREHICKCRYLDRLGNELREEGRFCLVPRYDPAVQEMYDGDLYFIQTMTDLQICVIEAPERVEYYGRCHELEGVEEIYGFLAFSDMVSSRSFEKIYSFAKYFILNTLPKLASLRNKHLIVKYLHWLDVQRLSRLNSAIRRVLSSDAVDVISLAKHLF